MRNRKPWYEKWYYFIGIITGLSTFLGVTVVGIWKYFKENNVVSVNSTIQMDSSMLFLSEKYLSNTDIEKIIKDNIEFILEQKRIKESDPILAENNFVDFVVTEEAAKAYYLNKEGKLEKVGIVGKGVSFATVLILDYNTDQIIHQLTANGEGITESLLLTDKIYCIVFAADYNLYVSAPIMFNENDSSDPKKMFFKLLKQNDEYTSIFQIAIKDTNGVNISNKEVILGCILKSNQRGNYIYHCETDEFSYISSYNSPYLFELNARYLIDICLDWDSEHKSIDGSLITNNLVSVQFDYEQ